MKKLPTPHYEAKGENAVIEKSEKVNSNKVIPEMNKIIRKSRELEAKFKIKHHEALL